MMRPSIDYGRITHRAALLAIELGCSGSLCAGPGWGPASCVHADHLPLRAAQLPHLSVDPSEALRRAELCRMPGEAEHLRALAVGSTDVDALRRRLADDHPLDRSEGGDDRWRQALEALLAACEVSS
jgi:hypothetical protein